MHYLIDGHNLIGQCRTIRLSDPDDELKLIDCLHRWLLQHPRHHATVIFDGGVYGQGTPQTPSQLRAIFTHSPQDADARLLKLIASAKPRAYRVVTSDRAIVNAATARGIEVIKSEAFAAQIETPRKQPRQSQSGRPRPEPKLSQAEVDWWLREFGVDPEQTE